MIVDICVITYRRPHGLLRLLGALQELRLAEPAPEVRVVVVDNDPEGSAREVCEEAAGWLRFPLVRIVEKRRGTSQARNTGIASALDRADFLAFVDDDAVPEPEWLAELLRVQANRHADAVAGPCVPVFEVPPARWLERGGLFEGRRHTTGASIDHASTANVLASVQALAGMDALFDERMGPGEGSDAEFFRRFAAAGRRIVWADSARVHSWIPPERATLGWLLRRAFSTGRASAQVDRRGTWPRPGVLPRLARALWSVAKGIALLPLAALRGRAPAARALRLAVYGAGRLAGQLDIS